ncbi:MAG: hypothetical protein L3K19_07590 [Thermoplasmata archaeon]|nr:hypothetical protein [Thermoplasmata archaeon]
MKLGELPFVLAVAAAAGIALGGVALAFLAQQRELVPIPFLAAIAFAAAYLYASHVPAPPDVAMAEDEPFDDPVEEADRISASTPPEVPGGSAPAAGPTDASGAPEESPRSPTEPSTPASDPPG